MNSLGNGYFYILLFSLILQGCAANPYRLPANPEKKLQAGQEVVTTVNANGPWRFSGVKIEKNQTYSVEATGVWRTGPLPWDKWTGPDGVGGISSFTIIDGYPTAALIGKIGDGEPFYIGADKKIYSSKTGRLYLMINKSIGVGDCMGEIEVTIKNISNNQFYQEVIESDSSSDINKTKSISSHQNNWAVIIGIAQYQYSGQSGLTNLIFADDDANAFARSLRNLGWSDSHIKLLTNDEATQRNIMIALKSWLTKAGPEDQIILFWAGHGYPDPEDPEKVYLATYDTDINIPATGYRMDEVRKALEEIGSKNVILFADTCHAGKLITRGDGSRGISIVPNIKNQDTPKGWVFMVGADTDRQAVEDTSWSNGAFTHSLVNGLNGAADGFQSIGPTDGIVTMGELRAYMNTAMPEETQKILGVAKRPVITTSTGDPDIWNLTLHIKQ